MIETDSLIPIILLVVGGVVATWLLLAMRHSLRSSQIRRTLLLRRQVVEQYRLYQGNRASPEAQPTGIFISYRRSDEQAYVKRLDDRLAYRYHRSRVFIDVASIQLGVDFTKAIKDRLATCKILVAVIGRDWVNSTDAQGRRRLEDCDDYVRLEIETALERNIRVIPVLVEDAQMPGADELPLALQALARRNGIHMSNASFESDTAKLIETLDQVLYPSRR